MTMEEQLRGLVDKFNKKMAEDEKTRDEVKHLKKTVNIDAIAKALTDSRCQGKEVVCNISYALNKDCQLMKAGEVVAHDQFIYALPLPYS